MSAPAKNLRFAEEPLDQLVGEAISSIRVSASHSPETLRQVTSYWRRWEDWAQTNGFPSFPADPSHVLLFIAARTETGAAPNTLRSHLRAIQQMHDEAGVPTVGFQRLAAEVIAGVERNRVAPRRRAPVLPVTDLQRMASLARDLGEPKLPFLRAYLMVAVGYTGGLRVEDLYQTRLEHLERTSAGYVLRLAGRGPTAVLLAPRDDQLDPVTAIELWREQTGLRAGPLLPVVPLRQPSRPMSKDAIVDRLARLAARAGCTLRPTGESLRRSWATHAYTTPVAASAPPCHPGPTTPPPGSTPTAEPASEPTGQAVLLRRRQPTRTTLQQPSRRRRRALRPLLPTRHLPHTGHIGHHRRRCG